MKKMFLISALLLASVALFANIGIEFAEMEYNFGKIDEQGGKATHVFTFKNNGNEPISISAVRASCGCTTPDWTKKPIVAGGEGEISVTYNPLGRPGMFSKTITITAKNSKKEETIVLKISGEVIKDKFPIKMGALNLDKLTISFKGIKKGQKDTRILVDSAIVYNNSQQTISVKFGILPKYLSAEIVPTKPNYQQRSNTLHPSQIGVLKIYYNVAKATNWGPYTDYIDVFINGNKVNGKQLMVFAELTEDFRAMTMEERMAAPIAEASPIKVNLGKIAKGEKTTYVFKLKNAGNSPLYIRYIDTFSPEYLTATYSSQPILSGKTTDIKVELNTSNLPEISFQKRIELVTNDPSIPKQYLTLLFEVVK